MRVLLCVLLLASPAAGAQGIDIKNARLGMSEAEITRLFPTLFCRASYTNVAERSCVDNRSSYGGADAALFFGFIRNQATVLSVTLSPKDFDAVAAALKNKYGEPTTTETPMVQNRAGMQFENTILSWTLGDEMLRARRYASNLDKSSVTVISKKYAADYVDRKNEETRSRAKDL